MDNSQQGEGITAEADRLTPEEEAAQGGLTPEEEAAQAALARADRPPASLGGPGVEADEPGDGTPGGDDTHAQAARALQPGAEEAFARSVAQQRADGTDVQVVGDEYLDSRDRVAEGVGDEVDLDAVQEWLLSDEAEVNTRKLLVRLGGSDDKPVIAPWYIKAIGIDVIRSAEREAAGANRAQRRGQQQQYDELKANLRIVVEGTLAIGTPESPDLKDLARQKALADPTIFLQRKFAYRPGAIAQIAGEVMALSGFDQEDVRAAGN